MSEHVLKDKADLLQDQDSLINDIFDIVEHPSDNSMLRLVGHIASGIAVISTQLRLQTLLMEKNYDDIVESAVQERSEMRATEIVEESNRRKTLGRRMPPPNRDNPET
jgi:hypothetical protein